MHIDIIKGTVLILIAASAWGLGGVAGQYLFNNYGTDAVWLVMVRQIMAGVIFLFLQRGGEKRKYFSPAADMSVGYFEIFFHRYFRSAAGILLHHSFVQRGYGYSFAVYGADLYYAVDGVAQEKNAGTQRNYRNLRRDDRGVSHLHSRQDRQSGYFSCRFGCRYYFRFDLRILYGDAGGNAAALFHDDGYRLGAATFRSFFDFVA